MGKIKVGIVGTGIGRLHARGYKLCEKDVEIVAVCDVDEGRAQGFANEFSVPNVFTNYEEMIRQDWVDAVSVCTPNALHAPVTIYAFENGKHVICEKPLSVNSEEGKKMVEAGKKAKKIFMMGFNNRFRGDSQLLKKFIENGDLGDIYYAKTGWLRRKGIPGWADGLRQRRCQAAAP